jgi:uncharacterized protein involved in exopolysaccharide biosynthesis
MENKETIDLRKVALKLWGYRKTYILVMAITFVVAVAYILPKPRYYKTTVSLAPEADGVEAVGGTLGSLASSFGVDLGGMQSSDAIYPLLYPDLLASSDFIVSLFNVKVVTLDEAVSTDYYTYLTKFQKRSPWDYPALLVAKLLNSLKPRSEPVPPLHKKNNGADPFMLSEKQNGVVEKLRNAITCSVDRKTNVISISVEDQDPFISATMADSVRVRLQRFITDYRTSKAKQDVEYYEKLTRKSKADYERVRQAYGAYADANTDVILQSYISKKEDLENDMQLKFNAYTAFNTQLQAARASLQKRTPAFTIIQGASVPQKPFKPKRMIFVVGMIFLAFVGTSLFILRKDLAQLIIPSK